MKKRKLLKHSFFLLIFSIVASIVFVVNSCKKETHNIGSGSKAVIIDSSLISQAKSWYQNAYPQNSSKIVINDNGTSSPHDWSQTLIPVWAKAQTYTKDSLVIIEMPVLKKGNLAFSYLQTSADNFNYSQSPSVTSMLIVIKQNTIGAYAMTIMGDSTYIRGNYSKLKNNTYRTRDKDFTGLVFYNAMDGTFINGWRYVNGVVINPIYQQPANTTTPDNQSARKLKIDVADPNDGCTTIVTQYWEQCSYYDDDVNYENPFNCFDYTVTDSYSVPCNSSGGGGGSGDISPPPPPPCVPPATSVENINGHLRIFTTTTSGGDSTTTVIIQTCPQKIVDSVTNPCLREIINQLTNDTTLKTDVTNMLRNTFGINDLVNITFNQVVMTGNDSGDDAYTTGQNTDLIVTFNTTQIANASQEFLLETTMHEMYHAYLDINPSIQQGLSQHAYMIKNYVTSEVLTLQQMFPNLSLHDAECLALAGYGALDQNTVNAVIAAAGLTPNDVIDTNNAYKAGTLGTKCKS